MVPEADALLASVSDETGLGDWGDAADPGFAGRVALLLENVTQAGLDDAAEQRAEQVTRWLLGNRLQLFADRARYPVADERIVRPLIAMGEPRSGTTLLHSLFAADPANRPVRFWELFYPSPPPGLGVGNAERMARADDDWRELLQLTPKWLVSHPYNDMLGQGLAECERVWAVDFRATPPTAWWRVPAWGLAAALPQDPARQYEIHRMTLQHLQYASPPRRWALKGFHHPRLGPLLDAYPDGHYVYIHRDPVVTTASFLELIAGICEGITGSADRQAMAAQFVGAVRARTAQIMADPHTDDPRILHITYDEFAADQVAAVARVYAHFGIEFTEEYAASMKQWLAANRADRYGKFQYSTDALGVDLDELYAEFEPYLSRFGVRREKR